MRASRLVWLPVAMMCVALSARASVFATVVLTPNNGLPGETIQVDGSDWLTDDTKTIDFVEVELNVGSALPTLGAFSTTFEVPSITPGVYTVRVSDGTEFTDATFTVDETAADPLVIIIESDADGDGAVDSTVSPYSVLEISSPAPYLVISVYGGGGAEYSLEFSNCPRLGLWLIRRRRPNWWKAPSFPRPAAPLSSSSLAPLSQPRASRTPTPS